jgi:heparosan-N-sulfate-glucuronate 5-epimerase
VTRRRSRLAYYRRVIQAYLRPGSSQLSFWHEHPEMNEMAPVERLGQYYMPFTEKADYQGPFDANGVPQLDYRGSIGVQYNPIAIAQYGLANYNRWLATGEAERRTAALRTADWLVDSLEPNGDGLSVWHHHFDWEYRDLLQQPWYSGLAQGQGVSLLLRAHAETTDSRYLDAAKAAFEPLVTPVAEGGTLWRWPNGDPWIEEYIVDPPTHILNGFLWALWGVHDYHVATGEQRAGDLFDASIRSLVRRLEDYDLGYWSLYEQSGTRLPMVASPFYHRLHVVQLRCTFRMAPEDAFLSYADRWEDLTRHRRHRVRAMALKGLFKALYY